MTAPRARTLLLLAAPLLLGAGGETAPDLWEGLVRVVGLLLVVAVLGVLATRYSRHLQPQWGGGPIRVLDGKNLAPGVGVRLIKVGGRAWLLGVTRERVSLIAELGEADLPPEARP